MMLFSNLAIFERDVAHKDWAFMCTYDIRDSDGELYLRRWRLLQTPWFALYLHKILRPDVGRDLHDHPWNFISWVLKGGYHETIRLYRRKDEEVPYYLEPREGFIGTIGMGLLKTREYRIHKRWSLYCRRAEDFHQITDNITQEPTWTLFLTGKRRREWGFLRDDMVWVPHTEYEGKK